MAQLVVRHLEKDVKARLRQRAAQHGRSMEAEVREILRNAVREDTASGMWLGSRLAARFAGIGVDLDIPERRGEEPRPAWFDE